MSVFDNVTKRIAETPQPVVYEKPSISVGSKDGLVLIRCTGPKFEIGMTVDQAQIIALAIDKTIAKILLANAMRGNHDE